MEEFINLLRDLKKNDKVNLNVLLMITDSQTFNCEMLCKTILNYYKEACNKEAIREFLNILCTKNDKYLEYFVRYSKIFEDKKDDFYNFLQKNKTKKSEGDKEETSKSSSEECKEVKRPKIERKVKTHNTAIGEYDILFGKLQCKLCGLRYSNNEKMYNIHIEDHMRKSRALDEKSTLSREYFFTYESWIKSMEKIVLNLKIDKAEKIIHHGDTVYCKICGNKIETIWDEEADEFILDGCVKLAEDEFTHKMCVM